LPCTHILTVSGKEKIVMQNEVVKEWVETTKSSVLDVFKRIIETNNEAIRNLNQNLWNVKDFADFTKTALDSTREIKKLADSSINKTFRDQMGVLNLSSSVGAIKDLRDMLTDVMGRLTDNQKGLVNIYMDSLVSYLDVCSNANSVSEMIAPQAQIFSDMQKRLQDHTLQMVNLFDSLNIAMSDWVEKSVNRISGEQRKEQ
jgi:uncharacterized phage infection (PIP) family protein YhgE